jgi:pimeloyl-ACP methyl ester carboxylesterase
MRAIVLALALASSAATPAAAEYLVKEVGSFHIGGRTEILSGLRTKQSVFAPGAPPIKVDPNGEFEVEQMYVQYVRLVHPRGAVPILFWHGGGRTGVMWETKPDGKPGWEQFFLQAGFDVYLSDAVERGRASWARFPEIFRGEPFFRTKKEAWELFRIGPQYDLGGEHVAFKGVQFPVEAFDQFTKQLVPRWTTNNAPTQKAYDALVQKVCPCVIVVHAQGSSFAFEAALNAPDKVKAVVAIEPGGAPDPAKVDAARVKGVPHLIVWGDFRDQFPIWQQIEVAPSKWAQAIAAAGGTVETFDLPKMGIHGNTHMLMMDHNSDDIAKLVADWLAKHGVVD